jgi:hypothetical protein
MTYEWGWGELFGNSGYPDFPLRCFSHKTPRWVLGNVLPETDGKYQTFLEIYKKGVIAIGDTGFSWLQPQKWSEFANIKKTEITPLAQT